LYDLTSFTMSDKLTCTSAMRTIAADAADVTEAAERVVRFLFESLDGAALVRLYVTRAYEELDDGRREFARQALGREPDSPKMKCLTLLATAGEEEAWNSPDRSVGHKAIPLASEQMVEQSPMIAQLIAQLGLKVADVLNPNPAILGELDEKDYNIFYVPVARNSPFIPAQEAFVEPYKIRSVLGVGGMLPSGEFFALILFAKVYAPLETARLFKSFALTIKSILLAAQLAEGQTP
jgi:hypothetical protein